jgi:hypothetical protein
MLQPAYDQVENICMKYGLNKSKQGLMQGGNSKDGN